MSADAAGNGTHQTLVLPDLLAGHEFLQWSRARVVGYFELLPLS